MELIVAYLVVVVVFQGLFAIRAPHEDALTVFVLCICWPASIVIMLWITALSTVGWEVEVARGNKRFGFRKPTNPAIRGFAITMFGTEFQFYTMYKKA
jgi:hypothetical protein